MLKYCQTKKHLVIKKMSSHTFVDDKMFKTHWSSLSNRTKTFRATHNSQTILNDFGSAWFTIENEMLAEHRLGVFSSIMNNTFHFFSNFRKERMFYEQKQKWFFKPYQTIFEKNGLVKVMYTIHNLSRDGKTHFISLNFLSKAAYLKIFNFTDAKN
jgi:hypothetical protein